MQRLDKRLDQNPARLRASSSHSGPVGQRASPTQSNLPAHCRLNSDGHSRTRSPPSIVSSMRCTQHPLRSCEDESGADREGLVWCVVRVDMPAPSSNPLVDTALQAYERCSRRHPHRATTLNTGNRTSEQSIDFRRAENYPVRPQLQMKAAICSSSV